MMREYRVEVNGEDLHFRAHSHDEAVEIIRQTLPQSMVDLSTVEEVDGDSED